MLEPSVKWARASESDYAADYAVLAAEERERAGRFRYELHRKRWVFSRAWLRRCLGQVLRMDPSGIEFQLTPLGKPYLNGYPLHFNLAHSGDYAILAWTPLCEVGVDIEEQKADFAWDDVAAQAFSDSERGYLSGLAEAERREAFYDIWTLKEAYVKALGCGIGVATKDFTVKPERVLDGEWNLKELAVHRGYSAAVAWKAELL